MAFTGGLTVPILRTGIPLQIGQEKVSFGRNILREIGQRFVLQHRLFVNDPWELIAESIHRAVAPGKIRDIAHSFRRQAEDYFRAATVGRELAVRPVLLYYAFLNLSKAYAIANGNVALASTAYHGISTDPNPEKIPGSLIRFDKRKRPTVFADLLQHFGGDLAVLDSTLSLGHLLPQILPGHRLWCYATNRRERFLAVEKFEILHSAAAREVWVNMYFNADDLKLIGAKATVLSRAGLQGFEVAAGKPAIQSLICFQQSTPVRYSADPAEALDSTIRTLRNKIWETVKVASPYRKPYIYCCPAGENSSRLPQILSVYLLMFFLGSVTRYSPGFFEDLLDSRYGPLIDTFLSEAPMQFLYLMASEILGREVSKPAII